MNRTKKLDRIDRMNKIIFILNSCSSLIFNFSKLDILEFSNFSRKRADQSERIPPLRGVKRIPPLRGVRGVSG